MWDNPRLLNAAASVLYALALALFGAERYDLLQFHFHTPSEHRVAGRSFPMEIHFVHRNARGQLAVGPGLMCDELRQLGDAHRLVPERAELLLELRHHVFGRSQGAGPFLLRAAQPFGRDEGFALGGDVVVIR